MVVNLWKYRWLIVRHALHDLRTRYAGSVVGYLWNVLIPLAQIAVFSVIFSTLMNWRAEMYGMTGRFSFVIFLCAGLLPWNAFADTVMRGVGSLVGNTGYLKTLRIPEQIFVARDACSGFLSALLAVGLFLVFTAVFARWGPFLTWLQILPALVLYLGFAFGVGLLLSCLNVFFRDVQPLMNIVLLLWFWVTPIVYPETALSQHPTLVALLHCNPAYHFTVAFHEAVGNRWVPATTWLICVVITLTTNAVAYLALRRLRPEIRDVL